MTALLRFLLGLPARPEDIAELQHALPELFANEHSVGQESPSVTGETRDRVFILHPFPNQSRLREELLKWIGNENESAAARAQDCPLGQRCPLQGGNPQGGNPDEAVEPQSISLIAGGPSRGNAGMRFIEETRRIFRITAKRVIITDRYIQANTSEDGTGKGFQRLCDFLDLVLPDRKTAFELQLSTANAEFKDRIRQAYPNSQIKQHRNAGSIHDRFYLVESASGEKVGMVGPSLNSVDASKAFFLGRLPPHDVNALFDLTKR